MTRSAHWPTWLTPAQFNAIQSLASTVGFTWSIRNEAAEDASAIYGRRALDLGKEINVVVRSALYDLTSTSLVGVYPHNQGFYLGGREPGMVDPIHSATGTADEVLDLAKTWAAGGVE